MRYSEQLDALTGHLSWKHKHPRYSVLFLTWEVARMQERIKVVIQPVP